MKRIILSLMIVAGVGLGAAAQENQNVKLSVGADIALPLGDIADVYSLGYGGSVQGALKVARSLDLTLSAGYLNFTYKSEIKDLLKSFGEQANGEGAIPLKAGAKYYFGRFYGAGELGASISTAEEGATAFLYAPSVGIQFPLTSKSSLDLGLRYEGWANDGYTSSFMGLRAAWSFGL